VEMGNYRKAAEEGNFFLRGFNLFIMEDRGRQAARLIKAHFSCGNGPLTSAAFRSSVWGWRSLCRRFHAFRPRS
jgi:hypothetical protein